ncbi:MAG: hypothetical protein KBF12_04670 [Sebaldella sp.]|nr:hypothetical protein [Sebaldella sp.]
MRYKYDTKKYFVKIILTSIFIGFLLIYAIIKNISNLNISIYTFIIIASLYELFNIYIAMCKPSEIELTDEVVIFKSFNKERKYEIKNLKFMMIKELSNKKLYLRIDNYNFLKGRYWLDTKSYENNQELYVNLLELERSVNPNQLKYNTRRIVKKSRSSGCYK